MRKFLLIATLFAASITVNAQHTTPRYGTAANQDRTYRQLSLAKGAIADVASATTDTFTINPNAFTTEYVVTVTDTVAIAVNENNSWLGDELKLTIFNTSGTGHIVYLTTSLAAGLNWQLSSSGAKMALTTGKRATIFFKFDGVAWVEQYRMIQ